MDRRLIILLAWTAIGVVGCTREKSPPQSAAAAPVKVEMRAPEVSRPSANASRVSSSETSSDLFAADSPKPPAPAAAQAMPMAPNSDAADAFLQRDLAARAQAEEARQRQLDELLESAKLGALGGFGAANPSAEPPPALNGQTKGDQNPLRTDASPRLAPSVATENPLRETREPTIPATPPSPGVALPVVGNSPSGGAAPPYSTPLGGGSPIEPRNTKAGSAERAVIGGGSPKPSPPPVAFKPETSSPVVEDPSEFDTVEVLYGTDRLAGEQKASDVGHLLLQFLPTLAVAILGVCLIVVAIKQRSWLLGATAVTGLAACLLLGYDAVDEVLARIRGANHQGPRYTTDRSAGGKIEVGRCEVTIPRTHKVGEVETPSIFRLEINSDIARHLVLQKTETLASPRFHDLLRSRVEKSARRELFVFVHGFNVSFEEAALRTAQIHYDLKFEGAPIFFSWPANDKFIFTYPADETNVAWSVPHLKQFLLEIVKESRAQSVNLIAHSMGNRALAAALREIELEMHDHAKLFNQVILAAPDIDADDFRNNIAPAVQKTARGMTLYASSHDEALLASQFIHRQPRAGDAGDGLTVLAGIDTIDVTAIDQSFFGHSYYGSSHPVLNDLKALLMGAVPPRDRIWLSPAERDGLTYWIFQPARTAAVEVPLSR
jgi:esterase/lipase superfamily enzyme